MSPTFEQLRLQISLLAPPPASDARRINWVRDGWLGIAVDPRGAFEVFLVGQQVVARSSLVARHIEFDTWLHATGHSFVASRVVFPPAPHFLGFSTLVALELLGAGWGDERVEHQRAFDAVEPLIEMALRRASLSEESILGLVGELLVLEQLLIGVNEANPAFIPHVLDWWRGHSGASRDFILGTTAIEVKTTRLPVSEHYIHGLAQVDVEGASELSLFLLSVSLVDGAEEGFSLPEVVGRVLALLSGGAECSPLQSRFLADVARYASEAGMGYVHDVMHSWPVYQQRFLLGFAPRLYDMSDPNVRVLRRKDLEGTFVCPEAIQYQVRFPAKVSDLNPHEDWQDGLRALGRIAVTY